MDFFSVIVRKKKVHFDLCFQKIKSTMSEDMAEVVREIMRKLL